MEMEETRQAQIVTGNGEEPDANPVGGAGSTRVTGVSSRLLTVADDYLSLRSSSIFTLPPVAGPGGWLLALMIAEATYENRNWAP